MLHFAYGSNMHHAVMRRHAPNAEPLGVALLGDYRFVVTADGYASVEPARARMVYGVLWRLTPRDRVGLDAWENVAGGLYSAKTLSVLAGGRRVPVLVYLARPRARGKPKAGYMELVLAAASAWNLPKDYIASLQRWLPAQSLGAGGRNLKEFRWT
jgi:gamma-glutamylcyclotransferase